MDDLDFYEQRLRGMLKIAKIPVKPVYVPEEVRTVLNITELAFRRMCAIWEPPNVKNRAVGGLESYIIKTHKRVPFHGLVNWLAENTTYERERRLEK